MPAAAPQPSKIIDIQVANEGETVSILVKLSQQPSAASVKNTGGALILEIDGLALAPLSLSPPAGTMVTRVEAGAGKVTLSGAAFGAATTVIYRNAVLIEAKLAEPTLSTGASLMMPAPARPTLQPKPAALPLATPAPPAPLPLAMAAPPIALPAPAPKPPQPAHDLESHPAPTAETPAAAPAPAPAEKPAALPTASLAGIDAARCAAAAAELAKDAWALGAMGDQALCLLDAGKFDEAKNRLDQLAAITPRDWRVALGRAALDDHNGEKEKAQAGYATAAKAAPNNAIRAAISAKAEAGHAIALAPHEPETPAPSGH
jgi:hypothetical protein